MTDENQDKEVQEGTETTEETKAIEKSRKKTVVTVLLCLFGVMLCISVYMVASQMLDRLHSAETFEELRQELIRPSEADLQKLGGDIDSDIDWQELLLESYAALKEENTDFYGWLSISDTVIDYPVVYTPSDPDHYLRRAFDGSYSTNGVPFLDGVCYEGCGNYIVYGHHMKDGTMFTDLLKYADQLFWQNHPTIRFDTPEELAEYEVLAVFYGKVYYADDTGVFRYYRYTNVGDPDVFNEYITQVRASALYDTGIEAQPGDQLLTLSTCNYHTENGRFVVVARKISN